MDDLFSVTFNCPGDVLLFAVRTEDVDVSVAEGVSVPVAGVALDHHQVVTGRAAWP